MSAAKYDPILLEAARYPFAMTVAPRYADMDILKHLNNLALAEYHEEARTRFLMEMFGEDFLFTRRDYRMLPVKIAYDYLREAHYPRPLDARAGVSRIGNTSFEIAMALFQDGHCVCLASVVTVHVTKAGPAPLDDAMRLKLQSRFLRRD